MEDFIAAGDLFFKNMKIAVIALVMVLLLGHLAWTTWQKEHGMVNGIATIRDCTKIFESTMLTGPAQYRVVMEVISPTGTRVVLTIDNSTQRYDFGAKQPVRYYGPDPESHFVLTHHSNMMLAGFTVATVLVLFCAYMFFSEK